MTMDLAVREYIHDNQDRFLKDIARLVAQPSVSARNEGVEECALLVKRMIEEIGGTTKMLKLEGAPTLVYGEVASSSKKTLLFYNHYDVQPVEPLELWKSPPFAPEVRDGRMYGRGVSDDKGQLVARLKLVESYVKVHGEPPCNIKFCFEGEEEVGSGHLDRYVETYPDLFKSDAVIWEYGKIDDKGRPVIGLGVKGMIYLELVVRSLSQDAHSMYAAALPNPVWRLVRLLSLIKDEREVILIPGWYDKVLPLAGDELKVLEEEPSEAEHLLSTYGAPEFAGKMSTGRGEEVPRFPPDSEHRRHLGGLPGAREQDRPAGRGPLQDGLQAGARPGPRRALLTFQEVPGRQRLLRRSGHRGDDGTRGEDQLQEPVGSARPPRPRRRSSRPSLCSRYPAPGPDLSTSSLAGTGSTPSTSGSRRTTTRSTRRTRTSGSTSSRRGWCGWGRRLRTSSRGPESAPRASLERRAPRVYEGRNLKRCLRIATDDSLTSKHYTRPSEGLHPPEIP